MKLVSFYIISPDFINMFGRGGGRARIVARSEERPRAALFRPEGEKRPLIWPHERRATVDSLDRAERDLVLLFTCQPKCEDRRRPPYLRRSRSAAHIRRSSGRPSMFDGI